MKKTLMICIVAAGLVACGQKNEVAQNGVAAAAVPGQNQPAAVAQQQQPDANAPAPLTASPSSSQLVGTVAEVKDAAGYTYLKIKTASGEQWAAVPQASVKKGANVSVAAQMTLEKFESKTLNKTFDTIVFGTLAGGADSAPVAPAAMLASSKMPPGHPSTGGANASGSPQQHMSAPDAGPINVEKAEGANAKTVAEVWAGREGLKDKTVVVRGKVVKSLSGIMGMNWIHIHDGSGSQEKGDNDLTVTSVTDGAAVGDIVTITGTVRVDKDFGAGYRYAVIVEDAKIAK